MRVIIPDGSNPTAASAHLAVDQLLTMLAAFQPGPGEDALSAILAGGLAGLFAFAMRCAGDDADPRELEAVLAEVLREYASQVAAHDNPGAAERPAGSVLQ